MRLVVVGGGVAGVCCAEELCRLLPHEEVVLVAADRVLKVLKLWRFAVVVLLPLLRCWLRHSVGCTEWGRMPCAIPYPATPSSISHSTLQGVSTVAHITKNVEELRGAWAGVICRSSPGDVHCIACWPLSVRWGGQLAGQNTSILSHTETSFACWCSGGETAGRAALSQPEAGAGLGYRNRLAGQGEVHACGA